MRKNNPFKNIFDADNLRKIIKNSLKNNKLLLKSQQRFKSEMHSVFSQEINKIASSLNDYKRMQSIDTTKTYEHGTGKDQGSEKKRLNVIKRSNNA